MPLHDRRGDIEDALVMFMPRAHALLNPVRSGRGQPTHSRPDRLRAADRRLWLAQGGVIEEAKGHVQQGSLL